MTRCTARHCMHTAPAPTGAPVPAVNHVALTNVAQPGDLAVAL